MGRLALQFQPERLADAEQGDVAMYARRRRYVKT
jgi:hypothetical protein